MSGGAESPIGTRTSSAALCIAIVISVFARGVARAVHSVLQQTRICKPVRQGRLLPCMQHREISSLFLLQQKKKKKGHREKILSDDVTHLLNYDLPNTPQQISLPLKKQHSQTLTCDYKTSIKQPTHLLKSQNHPWLPCKIILGHFGK